MTSKVNTGKFSCQYGYDLRNRLASANITRKEGTLDVTITSSYTYNTAGIRTRAEQTINGITQNRYFLLDSGHTGYAQVFEETSTLGGNLVRSYVLGDDVLSQNVGGVTSYLLYDGHGSTRQLAGEDGTVSANYAYDAYGKMLGGNPNVTDKQSATDLLYAGEQFDPGLQMEYLRARYYDQDNGRFNRLDPFDGNSEDPQSLHKYAYAHADPVNDIDPSGEFLGLTLAQTLQITFITLNIISFVNNTASATTFSYQAYQSFAAEELWDGILYSLLATLHGGLAALNILGVKASMMMPPPQVPALALAGTGAAIQLELAWSVAASPAMARYIVESLGPAVLSGVAYFAAPRHSAKWQHRGSNGKIKNSGNSVSGSETPNPGRLSFPEQLKTHTERKILDNLISSGKLNPGDIITIQGSRPPCNPGSRGCFWYMTEKAKEFGIKIFYTNGLDTWFFGP